MSLVSQLLISLVAGLCFYIMYLETVVTDSAKTAQVFKMDQEELKRPSLNTLFKNQGVYNGLLGLGLLYGAFLSPAGVEVSRVFLVYMIAVAAYGAISSDKGILLKQGALPILALVSLFF